jgi:hypothetical protein
MPAGLSRAHWADVTSNRSTARPAQSSEPARRAPAATHAGPDRARATADAHHSETRCTIDHLGRTPHVSPTSFAVAFLPRRWRMRLGPPLRTLGVPWNAQRGANCDRRATRVRPVKPSRLKLWMTSRAVSGGEHYLTDPHRRPALRRPDHDLRSPRLPVTPLRRLRLPATGTVTTSVRSLFGCGRFADRHAARRGPTASAPAGYASGSEGSPGDGAVRRLDKPRKRRVAAAIIAARRLWAAW